MKVCIEAKDFGLIAANYGEWNEPSVEIYSCLKKDKYGHNITEPEFCIKKALPKVRSEGAGIIEMMDGSWQLLSEDDDHYSTKGIFTSDEIIILSKLLLEVDALIGAEVNYAECTSKDIYKVEPCKIPDILKKGCFSAQIQKREASSSLLILKQNNIIFDTFDVSHLSGISEILAKAAKYIKENN